MKQELDFLPRAFLERMERMSRSTEIGSFDFEAFCASYFAPRFRGIRRNPLKATARAMEDFWKWAGVLSKSELAPKATPFGAGTYYLPADFEGIGRLALHHAGAYYVQEPSASSAVEVLCPAPGERVLDLCAAPGGKATQIGGLLKGKGLLWANEIVKNRAMVLLSNVERMGIRNAVVSSCHPERLCAALEGFFDKVLVDAPCSGEGMFAKEEQAVTDWSLEHTEACAVRQLAILDSAAKALREGGILVYSTCTFAPEENEGVFCKFMDAHPEFEPLETMENGRSFGRPAEPAWGNGRPEIAMARRIFPMDGGAGHFIAKFRKKGESAWRGEEYRYPACREETALTEALYREIFHGECYGRVGKFGDHLVLLPEELPALEGLGVLRAGVAAGTVKKGRIEPEHGLFAAAMPAELRRVCDFAEGESPLLAFLRGEEIEAEAFSGYSGVTVDGVVLGFGKASGGRLKNHYPKGLRNLK